MTQNTAVKASAILDGAADYIEKYGLHKGWYWKGFDVDSDDLTTQERATLLIAEGKTPPCCTIGALVMANALAGGANYVLNDDDIKDAIRQGGGVSWWDIPDWNDKPSQRKSRVVATLRKAAEFARKENK